MKRHAKNLQSMTFQGFLEPAVFERGDSVLQAAIANDIPLLHSCGGMGSCGTCRVFVETGIERLPAPNEIELERITDLSFPKNERLACQIPALPDLKVRLPDHD